MFFFYFLLRFVQVTVRARILHISYCTCINSVLVSLPKLLQRTTINTDPDFSLCFIQVLYMMTTLQALLLPDQATGSY